MSEKPVNRESMFPMINAWQKSGVSQKAFCKKAGISYSVFHYWYKCYRDQEKPGTFIELKAAEPVQTKATIEICFPNGIRVLFHEPVSFELLKSIVS